MNSSSLLSFVESELTRLPIVLQTCCAGQIDGCLLSRLQQRGNVVPAWLLGLCGNGSLDDGLI